MEWWVEALKQGGLFVLCFAEGAAIVALWRRLIAAEEARIAEMKESTKAVLILERLVTAVERSVETMNRSKDGG